MRMQLVVFSLAALIVLPLAGCAGDSSPEPPSADTELDIEFSEPEFDSSSNTTTN